MSKTVLITGASSGFGNLMAKSLLEKGHQVVETMRGVSSKNQEPAEELAKLGAKIIELDVTDDKSVDQAMTNALREVGKIDVVVNNAGVGVMGLQESFTIDDFKKLFDINVFGVQRVLRSVIPHMRENNSGLIINISSILGRMTVPFYGPYNASKWALEAMSENYRTELSQFGIDVCLVEPGGYPTTFMDRLIRPEDNSRDAAYQDMQPSAQGFFDNFEQALASNPAQNPQDVANAVVGLVEGEAGSRKFRTIVDKMGMGDHLEGYNDSLGGITQGVYGAFGIDHLLNLKK